MSAQEDLLVEIRDSLVSIDKRLERLEEVVTQTFGSEGGGIFASLGSLLTGG